MALNEFMSRQVRRKQKPEFNPGSASVLPPAPPPTPPSPTSYTYFNYTHVVAITFHFVLLSLHTPLHLHHHHHLRPVHLYCLPAQPACLLLSAANGVGAIQYPKLRLVSHVNFTPTQWKRSSHLSPNPARLSSAPGRVTMAPKDNEFSRENVWFNWFRLWVH